MVMAMGPASTAVIWKSDEQVIPVCLDSPLHSLVKFHHFEDIYSLRISLVFDKIISKVLYYPCLVSPGHDIVKHMFVFIFFSQMCLQVDVSIVSLSDRDCLWRLANRCCVDSVGLLVETRILGSEMRRHSQRWGKADQGKPL